MLELIAVDGRPVNPDGGQEDRAPVTALLKAEMEMRAQQILTGQRQIMSLLLAQQQEISKLHQALATVRISRTQEIALLSAIRARAALLAQAEGLPGSEKRIAGAIRTTLRETTGARAIGDLQACQFDRAMDMVTSWRMSGALRRIRREAEHEQA